MTYKGSFLASLFLATTVFCHPTDVSAVPLSLNQSQDLVFGRFVGGTGVPGDVTVDLTGARVSSGGATLLSGEPPSAATFTITGSPGAQYRITVPSTFTISLGGQQMTVSSVTSSIPSTGTLPAAGSLSFTVGGTLTVGATQQSGIYAGTFTVSVK